MDSFQRGLHIAHSHLDIGVPQEFLDNIQAGALHDKMES